LRSKKRYLNLRNTMFQLLSCNVIPIINENDSVGTEEIQFGNNDMLAAQVALLIQADVFVNLTDVGGLFDKNPRIDKSATHIPVIKTFSSSIHNFVSDKKNPISVGGMSTKLKAAEIVTRAGIFALIGDGFNQSLCDVLKNQSSATLFIPSEQKMSSRHRWIAFTGPTKGSIVIDNGATKAIIEKGKSILPAGVIGVNGVFKAGDKVEVKAENDELIAAGLVNYSTEEANLIKGCKTSQINTKLGRKGFDEVIHRDNLVLLNACS
ncbi:MAG: glutamate 5-kinase, partial [Fibrobacter sp.]|nr:glutamate 5-kinase [Fibrobacter sp.]